MLTLQRDQETAGPTPGERCEAAPSCGAPTLTLHFLVKDSRLILLDGVVLWGSGVILPCQVLMGPGRPAYPPSQAQFPHKVE